MTDTDDAAQILLVDDNPANLDLLGQVLREAGYRIRTALSGRQALDSLRFAPPDLLLLDISMPGMSGFEVCEALRGDPAIQDVPVIFISALDEVADKVKAFRIGGADYVTKPFQADEVRARVAHQIQLRRLRTRLETQNRSLLEAYAGLQELEQLKAAFAAMLVHDLRAPLTSLAAVLDLYEEQGRIEPSHLARCRQSIQDVADMLNDLMELHRSENRDIPLDPRPLSPQDLLDAVKNRFASQFQARGLRLELACPAEAPPFLADPQKADRILSNLVGNALKFTPSGGCIRVEVDQTEGSGVDAGLRWVTISVTDTGRGIPAEQLPYIFDPYRQASRRDAASGFGLGLAIVQRLMAAHKGRVLVHSQVGVGSTFTLCFPLHAP